MLIRISLYAIYQTICRILRWQDSIVSHKIHNCGTDTICIRIHDPIDRSVDILYSCTATEQCDNWQCSGRYYSLGGNLDLTPWRLFCGQPPATTTRSSWTDHGLRLLLAGGVQRAIKWEYVDKVKSTFAGHRWDTEIVSHAFQHISTTTQPRGLNNIHRTCPTYRILLVQYFY